MAEKWEHTAKAPPVTAWGFSHGLTRYAPSPSPTNGPSWMRRRARFFSCLRRQVVIAERQGHKGTGPQTVGGVQLPACPFRLYLSPLGEPTVQVYATVTMSVIVTVDDDADVSEVLNGLQAFTEDDVADVESSTVDNVEVTDSK